ncbi:hypothetical protein SDC9_68733 [bioreactor metagenome]|uniref:Uncharacterized protein n=1 Tax=bioreactor metagenome TaxID=1076179 RepID=A0A644Y183_9ZZZZ
MLCEAVRPTLLILKLPLHAVNVLLIVGDGGFQHSDGGVLLRRAGVLLRRLRPQALRLHVLPAHSLAVLLPLGVQSVQPGSGLIPGGLGGVEIGFQLSGPSLQRIQILQPCGYLQQPQLVPEDQIFFRLLRLIPQGLHLKLQLRNLVVDAHQIFIRALQFSLRLFLAVTVF